jgi:hypothetical protein
VVVTVDHHANTSAASIPLALDTAVKDGRIKKGDLLLLEGIGGGLAWGASLVRWYSCQTRCAPVRNGTGTDADSRPASILLILTLQP